MKDIVAAVLVKSGKILLQLPSQNFDSNKYEFPGGVVKWGETLVEAMKRELYNETGIDKELSDFIEFENNSLVIDGIMLTVFILYLKDDDIILNLNLVNGEILEVNLKEIESIDNLLETNRMMIPAIMEYFYPSDLASDGAYIFRREDDVNIFVYYKTDYLERYLPGTYDKETNGLDDTFIVVFHKGLDYVGSCTLRDVKEFIKKYDMVSIFDTDFKTFRVLRDDFPLVNESDYNWTKKFCKNYIRERIEGGSSFSSIRNWLRANKCFLGASFIVSWIVGLAVACGMTVPVSLDHKIGAVCPPVWAATGRSD